MQWKKYRRERLQRCGNVGKFQVKDTQASNYKWIPVIAACKHTRSSIYFFFVQKGMPSIVALLWCGSETILWKLKCAYAKHCAIVTEMVMIEWHMVILKYDTCRKERSGNKSHCIPVFLCIQAQRVSVCVCVPAEKWLFPVSFDEQHVTKSVSECDRTDFLFVVLQLQLSHAADWACWEGIGTIFIALCHSNAIDKHKKNRAVALPLEAYVLEIWLIFVAF